MDSIDSVKGQIRTPCTYDTLDKIGNRRVSINQADLSKTMHGGRSISKSAQNKLWKSSFSTKYKKICLQQLPNQHPKTPARPKPGANRVKFPPVLRAPSRTYWWRKHWSFHARHLFLSGSREDRRACDLPSFVALARGRRSLSHLGEMINLQGHRAAAMSWKHGRCWSFLHGLHPSLTNYHHN